jgi:hypothetical protein
MPPCGMASSAICRGTPRRPRTGGVTCGADGRGLSAAGAGWATPGTRNGYGPIWRKAGEFFGHKRLDEIAPSHDGVPPARDHRCVLVPELQERGVNRTEYTGATLREHLGLQSALHHREAAGAA